MTKMNENFFELEAKYNQLSAEIDRFKAAFGSAGQNIQEKYQDNFNHLARQQQLAHEKLNRLEHGDATVSDRQEIERLLQSMEQQLLALKGTPDSGQSLGWPEGQASSRPHNSLGWPEGQASSRLTDSKGWAEGQAETQPTGSKGWAEGYDERG